jgi:plastocyanin
MNLLKKSALLATMFFSALLLAHSSMAGEIEGAIGAPKPENAVVYVEKVPGTFPGGKAKMDQNHKAFVPSVLPVMLGTSVEFHNSDSVQHNVFGVGADQFNLGTYGTGAGAERTFSKLGEVDILCNVHPEMQGYVLVLQNPYFAQPDHGGKFRIADVPAGDYVVMAWYDGKTKKQNVKVPAKGSASVSF